MNDDRAYCHRGGCGHFPERHPLLEPLPEGEVPAPACGVEGCGCPSYVGAPAGEGSRG